VTFSILAMHGWAGDSRGWEPFATAAAARGWTWQCLERGYGTAAARSADWDPAGRRRVLVAHSLGPHLLPAALLASADAIVLLASFGRFIPPGREGRQLATAIAGMTDALAGAEAEAMLRRFLAEAAAPQPLSRLNGTIVDTPLGPAGRRRLHDDLALLAASRSLPAALPADLPCLIVEAGADRIVAPRTRELLRQERPAAAVLTYPEAGHCLLDTPVVPDVIAWIASL
jgi:pimeloyl-[acyl-carrier protein] methyl ester esterase